MLLRSIADLEPQNMEQIKMSRRAALTMEIHQGMCLENLGFKYRRDVDHTPHSLTHHDSYHFVYN
jgi:hypothetical protein